VTILLQNRAGKSFASHHKHGLAIFLQLVHQRDKIAVAADNRERIHMRVRERHFQRVQRQVNVGAVLISARRWDPLHHLDGVFGHLAGGSVLPPPIRVSELGDDIAALLQRIQRQRHIEFAPQRRLESDLDVVVIDKHRDVQFVLHVILGRDFHGKVVLYGLRPIADIRAENIEQRGPQGSAFDVAVGNKRERATLRLVGIHNVYNALAAVGVALERGLSLSETVGALASLLPADKRGQVVQLGNITVIDDCYNSNPKALQAMVEALAAMPAKRRIVVAGEMLELGPAGEEMHRHAGQDIAEKKIDMLVGVRGLAQAMVEAAREAGMRAEFVATPEEAGEWLARETCEGDVVLLKASRGVKLERALETWTAQTRKAPAVAQVGNTSRHGG